MELYICKNKDCRVHTFYDEKGFYSVECPLCNRDDIKNGNRANAEASHSDKEVNNGNT